MKLVVIFFIGKTRAFDGAVEFFGFPKLARSLFSN